MKNLILFIGLGLFAFTGNGNAQTCSHGSKTAMSKSCTKPSKAALKAAASDPSIETKTCGNSKYVCFMKKTTDAQGNVSTAEVKYDEANAQFVSATETGAEGSKSAKTCSMSKACCAKGAAGGKACCKAKGTASSSAAPPADISHADMAPAESSQPVKSK